MKVPSSLLVIACALALSPSLAQAQEPTFGEEIPPPERHGIAKRYGPTGDHMFQLYRGRGRGPRPLMIAVGARGIESVFLRLSDEGITVAVIGFPDPKKVGFATTLNDLRRGIAFVLKDSRTPVDRNLIAIGSVGAGASWAGLLATDPNALSGSGIAFDAVRTVMMVDPQGLDPESELAELPPGDADRKWLVEAYGATPAERRIASVMTYTAAPNAPDFYLLVRSHSPRAGKAAARFAKSLEGTGTQVQIRTATDTGIGYSRTRFGGDRNPETKALIDHVKTALGID